ncbi:tyrosine-type recombinase/integrase [Halomonas saccharevitans]|nr:site-specific integrase [Halomonas saccharevitans]
MPTIKLTPSAIKNLDCPPGKRKVEYCDSQLPGFYVEVRASNPRVGTYYQRYKDARGKMRHIKIAKTTELSLTKARKKAQQTRADTLLGGDPRADLKRKRNIPTFSDFVRDQYLPYIKVHKRSWATDDSFLRNHIIPVFGSIPLDEISRTQLVTFHTTLPEKGMAPSTCDRQVVIIRYIFNLAIKWEVIDTNPAKMIELYNADNSREHYLTDEEMSKLLNMLQTHTNRPVSLVILLLLATGARRNEALKAKWEDIDLVKKTWKIPAANAKSKKSRVMPLNTAALQVLEEAHSLSSGHEYVFISQVTGQPIRHITAVWQRMRVAAGLPDFRLHDCRHQYASMLVNKGRSLYEVQRLLGHTTPKMTQRYSHLSMETLEGASSAVGDFIGDLTFTAGKVVDQ